MKVLKNIEALHLHNDEEIEILMHISKLCSIRKDREATIDYYDNMLCPDYRFNKWVEWKHVCAMNPDNLPQDESFAQPAGSVGIDKAKRYREIIFKAIFEDRKSFGYLFWCLASELNRESGAVLYECVPNPLEIDFATDFDKDDILKKANGIQDLKTRLEYISDIRTKAGLSEYRGDYYEAICQLCEDIIQSIKDEMILFPASETAKGKAPKAVQTHLPECFNNDTAKGLFQILIDLGVCVEDGELYKWKASAALFGVFVFWTSGRECLNLLSENKRIQWEPFKTAFKCDDSTLKTAQTFSSDYKVGRELKPNGGTELKQKLVEYFHCKLK